MITHYTYMHVERHDMGSLSGCPSAGMDIILHTKTHTQTYLRYTYTFTNRDNFGISGEQLFGDRGVEYDTFVCVRVRESECLVAVRPDIVCL